MPCLPLALLKCNLELLIGGDDAILQKMVRYEMWIVDKKCPTTHIADAGKKMAACKRRTSAADSSHGEEPPS